MCLACAFDSALTVGDPSDSSSRVSGFHRFAPQEAGGFGKYHLTRELGAGGMGVIWEAKDSSLQRTVAIKMIRAFAFSGKGERQRFQREATAVAQLEHPHIVPIYEVGEVDGQPYFTMKRLTGGTLSSRLMQGPMDPREAATIMEKLARAIAHAHERGVLHRDLKPDNVLFDVSGEPHLTDFGLAKLLDGTDGLTLTTAHVGTPHYMSPEQARGLPSEITTASDVWGAGALFYHMLTGQVPFPGASSGEVLDRVTNHDPVAMNRSSAAIDPDLETLCLRCMAKDPDDRLPSTSCLADELQRWLADEPIHCKRLGRAHASTKWLSQNRLAVAGMVLLLGGLGFFLLNSSESLPSGEIPLPSKSTHIPLKFEMETFSIDGDREGPRFFIGWTGQFPGIIPGFWEADGRYGSYIFHIEREDIDGGMALKIVNYHAAKPGRSYYLPNLSQEPVVYQVTDPLWNQTDQPADLDLTFLSFQHHENYLRHSGRMLFNHRLYFDGVDEKSMRIFDQDATWTVHQIR